ncbi:MAG: DNA polymerase III subunit alpha, partial [Cryomorphaceae bacterium]
PQSTLLASDLAKYIGKKVCIYGYLVTRKDTSTTRGERMAFGNFVDFRGAFIDTVHFPQVVRDFPFRGRGVYKLIGIVSEEFDCLSVEVSSMEKAPLIPDPRYVDAPAKRQA